MTTDALLHYLYGLLDYTADTAVYSERGLASRTEITARVDQIGKDLEAIIHKVKEEEC